MKNELEDFIKREGYPDGHTQDIWKDGVIEGAKYMAERMYSEEDLRQAYIVGKHGGVNQTYYDFDEWFEQFKKK